MRLDMDVARAPERFVPETMHEELLASEHLARYEWAAALAPGRRVLDAGCGTGYGAVILRDAGASQVVGVDIAAAVVEAARSQEGPALNFEQGDAARLPYPDASFDLVTCFEVIEHVPDPSAMLGELARVLDPAGVLAISSPNADRYPAGNPHHRREFTTSEFRALLGEAFPSVRLLAQHQWVSSAVFEQGDLGPGALAVRTVKATARTIGSEAYTVALAGARTLPTPPPAAALTGTVEVRRWLAHFSAQQKILMEQADYLAGLEALDAERRDLRRQLVTAETELAELRERVVTLERARYAESERLADTAAELAHVRHELGAAEAVMESVWRSASWRSTQPLRSAKARTARFRRG
jgi:2-polyprenyl-3-methyl-5-hydroxy-6-metoxy-1,4-benzoquinol methylase